jgi:hypothetical protein
MILTYLGLISIYATFFILMALNAGLKRKNILLLKMISRVVGLVAVIYIINKISGLESRLGHFLGGVGYLLVIFIVASFGGDAFFFWLAGKKNSRSGIDQPKQL